MWSLSFSKLKNHYPQENPCRKDLFPNQCAIKMSTCLFRSGIALSHFKVKGLALCWFHSDEPHVLRAEELSIFLSHKERLGEPLKFTTPDDVHKVYDSLKDKTGIIFYKDYWNRGSEKEPSGDHIDLWLGTRTMGGHGFLGFNYASVSLHLCQIFGSCSDERKSREIWFWEIK